jgi:hypothetical protein
MNHQYQQIYNFIRNNSEHFPQIIAGGQLTELEALNVYRQGYFARVVDALNENYPAIGRLAGDENFLGVAKEFINDHPSKEFNINNLSQDFADYLGKLEITQDYPFLVDLARLEWQRSRLFNVKDQQGLNNEDLLRALETEKPLKLVNSAISFRSKYPLKSIREAIFAEQEIVFEEGDYLILLFKSQEQVFISQFSGQIFSILGEPTTAEKHWDQQDDQNYDQQRNETSLDPQEVSEFFKLVAFYRCLIFQS